MSTCVGVIIIYLAWRLCKTIYKVSISFPVFQKIRTLNALMATHGFLTDNLISSCLTRMPREKNEKNDRSTLTDRGWKLS